METFLIIIGFIIPLSAAGYILSKLDKALHAINAIKDKNVIVFGNSILSNETIKILIENNINAIKLIEYMPAENKPDAEYLLTLSESDIDNLTMSAIYKKVYNIRNIISICNDRKNTNMFVQEKIPYIFKEFATPELIFREYCKLKGAAYE